jgi:hypothetical protein
MRVYMSVCVCTVFLKKKNNIVLSHDDLLIPYLILGLCFVASADYLRCCPMDGNSASPAGAAPTPALCI